MKILFVIDTLTAGGKERRLTELIKGIREVPDIKYELIIMSSDIHYREILETGIKIHYVIRKTKKDISVFFKLINIFKQFKPDIVHCWDSMTAVYIAPLCLMSGIRMVNGMVIDSPRIQNISNKHWLRARLTFPFSNVIVGNSYAGLRAYRAPEKKSVVIYNGFNFKRLFNLPDRDILKEEINAKNRIIIGMVATFSANKDYNSYFSAAKKLLSERNDLVFLAIGKDTDSEEAKKMIGKETKDNFRLMGKRSDVEALINIMDICVLSTFTEGVSNSVLEYMALGKPVVATSGGGTNELVEDGKTGYLTKIFDKDDLTERIRYLIDNVDVRKSFGGEGKLRIEESFSIKKMVDNYIKLYISLLKK
jgi:glycosyltransferase involved in cell wall biosynthesis